MSFTNELRKEGAQFGLAAGAAFVICAMILGLFGSSWAWFFWGIGLLLMAAGFKSYAASSAVEGIPKLIGMISRHTEPKWDGEALYTDGGRHIVRYVFDARNRPYFVAADVCDAIGAKAPDKDATRWGGVPLLIQGQQLCFSGEAVEAYLSPLGVKNHEANRLLVRIRNEVFRRLDREREQGTLS